MRRRSRPRPGLADGSAAAPSTPPDTTKPPGRHRAVRHRRVEGSLWFASPGGPSRDLIERSIMRYPDYRSTTGETPRFCPDCAAPVIPPAPDPRRHAPLLNHDPTCPVAVADDAQVRGDLAWL